MFSQILDPAKAKVATPSLLFILGLLKIKVAYESGVVPMNLRG